MPQAEGYTKEDFGAGARRLIRGNNESRERLEKGVRFRAVRGDGCAEEVRRHGRDARATERRVVVCSTGVSPVHVWKGFDLETTKNAKDSKRGALSRGSRARLF